MLKQIDVSTSVVGALFKIDQPYSFKGIFIHFGGLSKATSGDATENELGRLKYRIRGKTIIDCDIMALMAYWKNMGGFHDFSATHDAIFNAGLYIPRWFGRKGQPNNVEQVVKEDNAELEITFNWTSTPQNLQTQLYLDLCEGVSRYNLTFSQIAEPQMAASAQITKVYSIENLCYVGFADIVSSLWSAVRSGVTIFPVLFANRGKVDYTVGAKSASMNTLALLTWSQGQTETEAAQAAPSMAQVYSAESDEVNNMLQDQVLINLIAGAGGTCDPRFFFVGAKINDYAMGMTSAQQNALLTQNIARKTAAGHTSAVRVLSKLSSK